MPLISGIVLKRGLYLLVLPLAILMIATQIADAGPFADFFKKVRRSITHPEQKSRSQTKTRKTGNKTPPSDASSHATSKGVNAPPNERNTRAGRQASTKKGTKSELRYGTPVPGKKGFVTSPFAPDSGYVDVRGFPPGTEVKDPYSGKVFLTP